MSRPEPEAEPPTDRGPSVMAWAISVTCVILPFPAGAIYFGLH